MRKTYAILSIIFTIIIAVIGFSGYSAGTHYMTFLGIELSQTGFLVLILAFVVFDIFSVKSAFGADQKVEAMRQESLDKVRDAQKLEGEPCTVTLTRLSSAVGAAMGVRVFLNGAEQEVLKNGKTITMRTDLAQNELSVAYNADGVTRAVSFEATPGGNVRITLKYTGAVLTVSDGAAPAVEADEKGRYRPLKTGYIVWAIINLPVYLLGLVPLVKTVRAAKQPDEILAQNQLRSARAWNIGLSCVLGVAAITAILMNLMR